MITNRSIPESVIIPELAYPDVAEAARWLCEAFGFQERLQIGNHRRQLILGTGAIVVIELGAGQMISDQSHRVLVRVENIDQHCDHAVLHGAQLIRPPESYPYGERQYTVQDIGGHIWTFSESIADVDPATWGGTLLIK